MPQGLECHERIGEHRSCTHTPISITGNTNVTHWNKMQFKHEQRLYIWSKKRFMTIYRLSKRKRRKCRYALALSWRWPPWLGPKDWKIFGKKITQNQPLLLDFRLQNSLIEREHKNNITYNTQKLLTTFLCLSVLE